MKRFVRIVAMEMLLLSIVSFSTWAQQMEEITVYGSSQGLDNDLFNWSIWTAKPYRLDDQVGSLTMADIDAIDSQWDHVWCRSDADDSVEQCISTFRTYGRYGCMAAAGFLVGGTIKFYNRFMKDNALDSAFTALGGIGTFVGCNELTDSAVEWCSTTLWTQNMKTCLGSR